MKDNLCSKELQHIQRAFDVWGSGGGEGVLQHTLSISSGVNTPVGALEVVVFKQSQTQANTQYDTKQAQGVCEAQAAAVAAVTRSNSQGAVEWRRPVCLLSEG